MIEVAECIRKGYWRFLADRGEERAILRFLRGAGADQHWRILDVGCGFGRNLRMLRDHGFFPSGVEISESTAAEIRKAGFPCYRPDDSALDETPWDAVLMSHIIEHFEPTALLRMMNVYLARLHTGGVLIIASPLPTLQFYDNFDHVKPYTPAAIEEVFGLRGRQVQYQSPYELTVDRLWLRRRAYDIRYRSALMRREASTSKLFLGGANIALRFLHCISFGLVGRTDGWVGMFRRKA